MKAEIIGFSWQGVRDDLGRSLRDEDERPAAGNRKLHQSDFAELAAGLAEDGLEHLLQAFVDAADKWRAVDHGFAETHQRPSDEIGGQDPEKREPDKRDDDAETGHMKRQIGG